MTALEGLAILSLLLSMLACLYIDVSEHAELHSDDDAEELSDEERAALVAGANVELEIGWLGVFPPVALNVTEERTVDG